MNKKRSRSNMYQVNFECNPKSKRDMKIREEIITLLDESKKFYYTVWEDVIPRRCLALIKRKK